MINLNTSAPCPEGHACGLGVQRTSQFAHECPAGYVCGRETAPLQQMDKLCRAGHVCLRGTKESESKRLKCNIGYYCPEGTAHAFPFETKCPYGTTSSPASSAGDELLDCYINRVDVCDKKEDGHTLYYPGVEDGLQRYKYEFQGIKQRFSSSEEVEVVRRIIPLNVSSSAKLWVNDTIEVFRTCPAYGPQEGGTLITVIGRNFRDTDMLTCRFAAKECGSQQMMGGGVRSRTCLLTSSNVVPANYISSTRVTCLTPAADKKSHYLNTNASTWTPEDPGEIRDMDVLVDVSNDGVTFSPNMPITLSSTNFGTYVEPCGDAAAAESSMCRFEPVNSIMLNAPLFRYVHGNLDMAWNASLWASDFRACELPLPGQEESRLAEEGLFLVQAVHSAKIQMDLERVPIEMTYDADFKIAIFVYPSECAGARCQSRSNANTDVMASSPCKLPIEFSDWFTCNAEDCRRSTSTSAPSTSERRVVRNIDEAQGHFEVDKHNVLNFNLFALEDVLVRVEVHLLSGLYLSSELFFRNSTTVDIVGGNSRARIGRAAVPTKRSLSKAVSFEQKLVPKEYFFVAAYRRGYADDISAPLNLPPYFGETQKGRVLTSFNASGDVDWIPTVFDKLDPEQGYPQYHQSSLPHASRADNWWKNDQSADASPCRTSSNVGDIERYRETFQDQATVLPGTPVGEQVVALPYLPFFSNCREFDSYIPISEIMEGPDCTLPSFADEVYGGTSWWRREFAPMVHPDDLYAVQFWDFFIKSATEGDGKHWNMPTADWCQREIQCSFEEDLFENRDDTPRWFEAKGGTLFDFYSFPIEYSTDYLDASTCSTLNDGSKSFKNSFLRGIVNLDDFVSLELAPGVGCGEDGMIPREVTLEISYQFVHFDHCPHMEQLAQKACIYPLDTDEVAWKKRIIKADLILERCDNNLNNTEYTLTTKFVPLDFLGLLVYFAFEDLDYFFLFVFIGIFTVLFAAIFYLCVRLTTHLRLPPKFQFWPFIVLIAPGPMVGITLACLPLGLLLVFVDIALRPEAFLGMIDIGENGFSSYLRALQPGFKSSGTRQVDEQTLNGRIGATFFIIGSYMILTGSRIFIPNRVSKRERQIERMRDKSATKETVWIPSVWKRSNLILCSYLIAFLLVMITEISFLENFGGYIWTAILVLKLVGKVVEAVVEEFLKEKLLVCPIMTAYSLTCGLVTFGAANFFDFLLSYIVEFSFLLLERVYVDPGANSLMETAGAVTAHLLRYVRKKLNINKKSKLEVDVFVLDGEGKAQLKKRVIEEDMPVNEGSETVEPIVDSYAGYANETVALFYQPVLVGVFLMWFREPMYIADIYGIKKGEMFLYWLFAFIIIFFQMAADVFILNVQELYHGWKIYDYLVYTRYRFIQRECRWKGLEDSLDECIEEGMRTLDQMCFSSQFFMMSTIHTSGMMFIVFAIINMTQTNYNMFSDFAIPILLIYILACCYFVKKLAIWCALKADLWRVKHSNSAWHSKEGGDDDFGTPGWDELGKIEGASHEAYLMNQRITSETFRYKFLNYNRAWLVSQLPSILTPRTLKRSRPYLVQQMMKIIGSVNPDVSTDSDSDDDGKPKFPPVSLSAASRNILRMWLAQARRRKRLQEAVQSLINAERKNECEQCLSRKGLMVELIIPLETMGDLYDKEHTHDKEFDQVMWKEVEMIAVPHIHPKPCSWCLMYSCLLHAFLLSLVLERTSKIQNVMLGMHRTQ
jgi:hypothetical protein